LKSGLREREKRGGGDGKKKKKKGVTRKRGHPHSKTRGGLGGGKNENLEWK